LKVAYIDQYKQEFGVQPICDVLQGTDAEIAPSTYYAAKTRPEAARTARDRELTEEIRVIHLMTNPHARYRDLGPDWHTRALDPARRNRDLIRQLKALGHDVTLTPAGA
jgi:hypothetical protein